MLVLRSQLIFNAASSLVGVTLVYAYDDERKFCCVLPSSKPDFCYSLSIVYNRVAQGCNVKTVSKICHRGHVVASEVGRLRLQQSW